MRKHSFGLSCALLATLALVPAARPAAAADPFVINVVLPLTGAAAFIGVEEQQTLHVLQDRINKQGGIRGRQVEFRENDDQSNPQLTVQLVSGALAQKAAVVLGPGFSATCNAALPLLTNGPVMYCFSPGVAPPAGSYMFSSSVSIKDEIAAMARYARGRGWKRIALITSTDSSGSEADRNVVATFTSAELVAREHFNTSDITVSAQMARIKAANPDFVIAWSTGPAFGTLLHGIADTGITAPIATTDGNETIVQMKQYASFMPKELYFPAKPALVAASADNRDLPADLRRRVADYFAIFRAQGIVPDGGHALCWDPVLIVVDAYKAVGLDATPAQIRQYIANLHGWTGVDGVYDFRDGSQRGLTEKDAIIVRWDGAKEQWMTVSRLGGEPNAVR
jgi:branched-chain amino acid transport system substrate-binding protein